MATNREIAKAIIEAYVRIRSTDGPVVVSYGQMAALIGRPGQQRLLGAPLDLVRDICAELSIPDMATVVLNQDSMKDGTLKPSEGALLKYGGWPGLRKEQARVMTFDWSSVRI